MQNERLIIIIYQSIDWGDRSVRVAPTLTAIDMSNRCPSFTNVPIEISYNYQGTIAEWVANWSHDSKLASDK